MGKRVVVTGSVYGSKTAFMFIRFILSFYKIKPIFITPKQNPPKEFDALIISGGVDICPSSYSLNIDTTKCQKERDILELELIEKAYAKEMPIFGICRGMQLINVFFKGTLYPDIHNLDLNQPHKNTPFALKTIEILPNTTLYSILKSPTIKVNALHHQAINTLGDNLRVSAKDKNGIIQAIEHPALPIIGVQWHPEFLPYMAKQRELFKFFLSKIDIINLGNTGRKKL